MVEPYRLILSKKYLEIGSEKQEIIHKKYVWKAQKPQKIWICTKKFGMESFDRWQPCLTSVNRCESIFFAAEKANSVE